MGYSRKIQSVGKRSFSISLPKEWILKNKLDSQDSLRINEIENKLIVSIDNLVEKHEEIKIDVEDSDLIYVIVLLCYTRGVSELMLRFKDRETYLKSKAKISEVLARIEGFRITDESDKEIIIKSFYGKADVEIQKLAKRMVSIINQMIECVENSDMKVRDALENEMDMLYHLSKRSLYICLKDEGVKLRNGILDSEEVFMWRMIFRKLENIADIIENIQKKGDINFDQLEDVIEPLNDVLVLNKKVDVKKINIIRAFEFENYKLEKIRDLVVDILNNLLLISLNKEYFG